MNISVRKKLITRLVAFMMAFTPIAGAGVILGSWILGSVAAAAPQPDLEVTGKGDNAKGLKNVQLVACNAAKIIRGPAGIAIGFLVVVGGIIALQVASRDALPLIGRGVFGTALLLGASAAFAAVVSTPCG